MSSQPLVSVCIPCYNGAEFIRQTLESVLGQTFRDFELVVADDRSTDATLAIVRGFADPRIRLIENKCNLGLGKNWNHALSQTLGKYVKLLCEDDLLSPECLARQVAVLENPSCSDVVLTVCSRKVINYRGDVILGSRQFFRSGVVKGPELIRRCVRRGSNLIGEPAAGLFRREAMKKAAVCDPANPYLSDLDLWVELLKHGDAYLDPECLAAFRVCGRTASAKIGYRQAAYFRAFAKKLRADSFYQIGFLDLMAAYVLSSYWCLARNAFITLHSEKRLFMNRPRVGEAQLDNSHLTCATKTAPHRNSPGLQLHSRLPNGNR